jgi:hypothetical protein
MSIIATPSFTITPSSPPGSFYAHSAWSYAQGQTYAALSDNGKWNLTGTCCGMPGQTYDIMNVVPGSTVGWTRTPNVMRVTNTKNCAGAGGSNLFPANGNSFFVRFYRRNDDTGAALNHCVWSGPCSGNLQVIGAMMSGSSSWTTLVGTDGRYPGSYLGAFWTQSGLSRTAWYRFEYWYEYIGSTNRYRVWPRIYNMAGTLVYDSDDHKNYDLNESLTYSYDHGDYVLRDDTPQTFWVGTEGGTGGSATGQYFYYADFACSNPTSDPNGWIGDAAAE